MYTVQQHSESVAIPPFLLRKMLRNTFAITEGIQKCEEHLSKGQGRVILYDKDPIKRVNKVTTT